LYISSPILAEYRAVLARSELRIRRGLQLQLLDFIKKRAHLVVPSRTIRAAGDPGDDIILECADEARADYFVTGNLRHFPRFWKSTKVVNTREFIGIVGPHLNP
ncbi:MAG: PIN domain-containing protein, partial [Candidatus Acidiferrum sp.]